MEDPLELVLFVVEDGVLDASMVVFEVVELAVALEDESLIPVSFSTLLASDLILASSSLALATSFCSSALALANSSLTSATQD